MVFPLLYALLGGPLALAGLVCSCWHWQRKPKTNEDLYTDDYSLPCFDNLQLRSYYSTSHKPCIFTWKFRNILFFEGPPPTHTLLPRGLWPLDPSSFRTTRASGYYTSVFLARFFLAALSWVGATPLGLSWRPDLRVARSVSVLKRNLVGGRPKQAALLFNAICSERTTTFD